MAEAARIRESLPKILRETGDIEPISEIIRPKKRSALRHSRFHPYFTSFPSNVVRAYIERHTKPDDLILDPFGGTGVTAVEALASNRRGT